ncbi:MAG: hypothetical protein Hals2KO_28730 [Halioglobus sp.]
MQVLPRILKAIFRATAAAAVITIFLLTILLFPVISTPDFQAAKGELRDATVTGDFQLADSRILEISLRSTTDLTVDLALRIPKEPLPDRPLLLMIAGQETGRKAVELLPDTRGVAVAALGYPFGVIPHRDGLAMARALPRIQRGILDTPAGVMLALDHLVAREDLAPERVELAGISFGAFLAAIPTVLDPRIERLWLIHGSGEPQEVIEAGLRERIPFAPVRHGVAWLLATAAGAHHLMPERWVGQVSPRPLVVVSALEDSALPPGPVDVLHRAVLPPAEILWSPGDHVHPKRPEIVDFITELMFRRISGDATADTPISLSLPSAGL